MKTRAFFKLTVICALASGILAACSSTEGKKANLPSISGKVGEIGVIASKAQWEADPGSAIRSVLAAEYPYLPQREPYYRLFNVPEESFNKVFRVHRNLLRLIINDTCSTSMTLHRDIWAAPQTMLTIMAPDDYTASEYINAHTREIRNVFESAERDRVISNAITFQNSSLVKVVGSAFGGSPYIPKDFSLKKQTPGFYWISNETTFTNQGIFIYKFPYRDESQFTANYLIAKRDEVMQINVPATTEGSYMITNPSITPGFEWKTIGDRRCAEIRSLWDTHNDFMGGPFISDAFLSKDGREIIVIEGFVYAPSKDKRDLLRNLQSIIYSWHWTEE